MNKTEQETFSGEDVIVTMPKGIHQFHHQDGRELEYYMHRYVKGSPLLAPTVLFRIKGVKELAKESDNG